MLRDLERQLVAVDAAVAFGLSSSALRASGQELFEVAEDGRAALVRQGEGRGRGVPLGSAQALGELLLRAGPNYKKHFQKREEQLSHRRAPERRVSAITGKAMWFNQYFYFRLALAVNTAIACLTNGRIVVCLGTGKDFAGCALG